MKNQTTPLGWDSTATPITTQTAPAGQNSGRGHFRESEITLRCKAFAGQGVRTHRLLVNPWVVRVYDPIAGYYTSCHSLSRIGMQRAKRIAANSGQ